MPPYFDKLSTSLTVAHIKHAVLSELRLHLADLGHIQRIVGTLTAYDGGTQRQSQRVQRRLIDLQLRQVRAMLLAMAELKQPALRDVNVAFRCGAVYAHSAGLQIIYTQQRRGLFALVAFPCRIVSAQTVQYEAQTVVTEVQFAQAHQSQANFQGHQHTRHPALHGIHPVVSLA